MPTVISGTSITFNDNSVQSANAIIATASGLHGQLGTYAFLDYASASWPGGTTPNPGTQVAGTSLRYSNAQSLTTTPTPGAPPGSWRLMGQMGSYLSGKTTVYGTTSLWLRYV